MIRNDKKIANFYLRFSGKILFMNFNEKIINYAAKFLKKILQNNKDFKVIIYTHILTMTLKNTLNCLGTLKLFLENPELYFYIKFIEKTHWNHKDAKVCTLLSFPLNFPLDLIPLTTSSRFDDLTFLEMAPWPENFLLSCSGMGSIFMMVYSTSCLYW